MITKRKFLPIQSKLEVMTQGPRPSQEDTYLIDEKNGIFVIADGFGGPGVGDAVAKLACDSIHYYLSKQIIDTEITLPLVYRSYLSLSANILFNAVLYANQKIIQWNQGKSVYAKGGTSLFASFIDGRVLTLANVGVCQALLQRGGEVTPLNLPQSFRRYKNPFSSTVRSDALLGDECGIPLSALGIAKDLEPEIAEYELEQNDILFLCTDGKDQFLLEFLKNNEFKFEDRQALKSRLEESESRDNFAMLACSF